jgi:hypothetical protein
LPPFFPAATAHPPIQGKREAANKAIDRAIFLSGALFTQNAEKAR